MLFQAEGEGVTLISEKEVQGMGIENIFYVFFLGYLIVAGWIPFVFAWHFAFETKGVSKPRGLIGIAFVCTAMILALSYLMQTVSYGRGYSVTVIAGTFLVGLVAAGLLEPLHRRFPPKED